MVDAAGLSRPNGLGALYAPNCQAVGLREWDVTIPYQFIDAPNGGNSAAERREGVAFVYALKVLNECPFVEGKGCAARCETPVDKLAGVAMVGSNGICCIGTLELAEHSINSF